MATCFTALLRNQNVNLEKAEHCWSMGNCRWELTSESTVYPCWQCISIRSSTLQRFYCISLYLGKIQPMKSGKGKVYAGKLTTDLTDLPVEALDWDWDEFCFLSEKKIHLCISSCWVKERLCGLSLIWLVYLKCKFLITKSLTAWGTENWASSEQDFCALNHTAASTRADSNSSSYLDTTAPLPTFHLKRQEQTLWSCSEASPISSLDLCLQKNWKPDKHYLELLDSLNSW